MNKFLSLPISELKTQYKTLPAVEGIQVKSILQAITKKAPGPILKESNLFEFEKNYLHLSKKDIPGITEYLKSGIENKSAIDVLISLSILNGSSQKFNWIKPKNRATTQKTEVDRYLQNDISFLLEQNDLKPIRQPKKLISEYVHGKRVMPPGSPFEGIYNIYKGQYVVEIANRLSPFDTTRYIALKKGVQIFATTIAEDGIAYYIGERPSKIMYVSATDALLDKFSTTRLDPLIDSCGLRDRIYSQSEDVKTRKSGNKTQYKEFVGGTLALVSAQSPAGMRSESIKILIIDEIDGAPRLLSTGEGTFLSVLEGRVQAFIEIGGKIFYLSTPGVWGESQIDEKYNEGDKRKFMVDCPMCKKSQWLCQGTETGSYGLKGDYKAGKLEQGYYQCYHCHDAIFESSKIQLLKSGVWVPTVESKIKHFKSYHLPSFYSPGLATFTYLREKYDQAVEKGDDEMRSYVNLRLAKSFQSSGEQPPLQSVIELRSTKYRSGEVPPGVLYLTMFGDVQKGKDKYQKLEHLGILEEVEQIKKEGGDPQKKLLPRLEFEIYGHGHDYRTSSIIYKIFYGRIDDPTKGAWSDFMEWANETRLVFKNKKGFVFQPVHVCIDSGYLPDVVSNFTSRWPWGGAYPTKGAGTPKKDKMGLMDIDERKRGTPSMYRISKTGSYSFILINTNFYKGCIYRNFRNKPDPINGQPPYCHQTPSDYPDSYFAQLRAESNKNGDFFNIAQRQNEALDLAVGNKCVADFWIDGRVAIHRNNLKKARPGWSKEKINNTEKRTTAMLRFEGLLRAEGWEG